MGNAAALMPAPTTVATLHARVARAETLTVRRAASHAPVLHGLAELHHAQALAGVLILVLEHGKPLLFALDAEALQQGRDLLLLRLAVAVGIRLQEKLVCWLFRLRLRLL